MARGAATASSAGDPGSVHTAENTLVAPWYVITFADALRVRRWARLEAPHLVPSPWLPLVTLTDKPAWLEADCSVALEQQVPLYVVDGDAGLPEPAPRPQFRSLSDFVVTLLRAFDAGLVQPGEEDPRVPTLSAALEGELRRLCWW